MLKYVIIPKYVKICKSIIIFKPELREIQGAWIVEIYLGASDLSIDLLIIRYNIT
jgi:hypothetical protein